MASIFLKRRELGGGERLPRVCIVCGRRGRPTDVLLRHRLSLPLPSYNITITTFQEAVLPLCGQHEDYFTRLNKFYYLAFGFLALLMLAAAASFFLFGLGVFALFFLPFVFCTFVFIVTDIIVTLSRTRATSIDDRGVWMAKVSERFVNALEDLRDGVVRVEEDKRSLRVDWDSGEEARRRRSKRGLPLSLYVYGCGTLVGFLGCVGVLVFLLTRTGDGKPDSGLPENKARAREVAEPQQPPLGAEAGGGPENGVRAEVINPPAPSATEENFRKLKVQMTMKEVRALLGAPQDEALVGEVGGGCLTWMNGRDNIQVFFKDDKLVLATAFVHGKTLSLADMGGPFRQP
jgi:hypothetical protein